MSEIKAGDLVIVVRWPCCGAFLGGVYKVAHIFAPSTYETARCNGCGKASPHEPFAVEGGTPLEAMSAPVSWLKKIDPPASELDTETERELTA